MSACVRWIALSDREALGEPLSAAEAVFLREHAAGCSGCSAEQGVWGALEGLGEPEVEPRAAPLPVAPPRRPRRPGRWAAGIALLAAAAGVAVALRAPLRPPSAPAVAGGGASPAVAPFRPSTGLRPGVKNDPSPARLGFTSGEVDVDGVEPAVGAELAPGAVVTAHRGTACLAVGTGVRACLAPGSRVQVTEMALPDRRLTVLGGRVAAELEPQAPGTTFTLAARDGTATAIGTAFSVEVPDGGGPAVARVIHGTVVVRSAGAVDRRVSAHLQAALASGPVTPLSEADEARDLAVLVPAVAADEAMPAVVRIASDPPGAVARVDERLAGVTPLAILLGAGEHTVAVESGQGTLHDVVRLSPGERLDRRFDLRGVAAEVPIAPRAPREARTAAAVADDAPSLLRSARDASARGDVGAAAVAYRALLARFPSSAEATASELSYGELELGAMRDPSGALHTFEGYLAHGGPLSEEASYGRARALRALGRTADERAAIDAFLRDHPGGAAAAALRRRAGELGEGP